LQFAAECFLYACRLLDRVVYRYNPAIKTPHGPPPPLPPPAYNSPQSAAAAQTMQQNTVTYNITKTPVIVVGGKYELTNSQNMAVLQELIEKVRAERGMPAPADTSGSSRSDWPENTVHGRRAGRRSPP